VSTEQLASLAFRNFSQTCRSPFTRSVYTMSLHKFMDYLRIPRNEYDKLLEKDPKIIQMDICDFIASMRNTHAPSSIATHVTALIKFYNMNDVLSLNWKKIRSFEPEKEKVAEDRPYTRSEVKKLIDNASLRNRAIILLMASSGVRVGAIPILRIKDLEAIDKYRIYKVNVYPKSKKSAYFSFCSPECRRAIDDYLEWRRRFSERLTPESPLFRRDYNPRGNKIRSVQFMTRESFQRAMDVLLHNIGLRQQPLEGQGYKRGHVMANHGLRKFFETNAYKAGMDHMYLRRLMGQKSGLEDAYLKLSEEELLEGDSRHVGYVGVIDQLTINNENRLKEKVRVLEIEKSKADEALQEIRELKKSIGLQ
jgi:integrase